MSTLSALLAPGCLVVASVAAQPPLYLWSLRLLQSSGQKPEGSGSAHCRGICTRSLGGCVCCAMGASAAALPVVFATVLLPTGSGSARSDGPHDLSWPFRTQGRYSHGHGQSPRADCHSPVPVCLSLSLSLRVCVCVCLFVFLCVRYLRPLSLC